MNYEFSAGGVIVKNDNDSLKVLLIKDRFKHWTWPKGHIEPGETAEQAALREIAEEVGLKNTSIHAELGEQKYIFYREKGPISKTVKIFLVEARGDELLVPETQEVAAAEWFGADEAVNRIEYEGSRALIEKGIALFLMRL
ncbi:MAG: NUDIX domain-containing protein [Candidatus Omnitrophica bacterium]|nr:NUDIX domain-containing protein [Candidatus Omnitrophota bacterium]